MKLTEDIEGFEKIGGNAERARALVRSALEHGAKLGDVVVLRVEHASPIHGPLLRNLQRNGPGFENGAEVSAWIESVARDAAAPILCAVPRRWVEGWSSRSVRKGKKTFKMPELPFPWFYLVVGLEKKLWVGTSALATSAGGDA